MKKNKEVLDTIKLYQANDYEIKEETETYVLMEKRTSTLLGHILVFIFFGWWTLGIANLIYWALAKKHKKVMK